MIDKREERKRKRRGITDANFRLWQDVCNSRRLISCKKDGRKEREKKGNGFSKGGLGKVKKVKK